MDWFDELVPRIESGNWLYNFICFCVGKRKQKLSYKEIYMILVELNRNALGLEKAKKASIIRVLNIYKYLHDGKLPEGVENEDGE